MTQEYKRQLFRLAAVLYADNNYEVTPKTIHRKVIESALLSNGNKHTSIHNLIDYIHDNYKIHFDEQEIKSIVTSDKEEGFLINEKEDDLIICLTEKRKQVLTNKISTKTIDFFIGLFETEHKEIIVGADVREIIYRFLYELLSSNIESFKKLLDSKRKVEELINVEIHSYTPIERDVINQFLGWDNNEKNKAIFDIASYALEYCMISNSSGASTMHLANLRNKVFYLDTNVLYRVLGINGINRQNRTKTFLAKFIDSSETLIISKFSEVEFKDSVKFYIDKLKRNPINRRLNPGIFEEKYFRSLSNFYDFYYKWRTGRFNDSLDLFEAHILSLYESFKNDFKIQTDYKIPFDEVNEKTEKLLKELSQDISSYKNMEGSRHGIDSDYNDACNIHLVDIRRDGKNTNLAESKFYLISTDQTLRRWDYNRNSITPIVILPSQWLSIVLRYSNRTSDDFKSFVSFLNLPHAEKQIDSEKLHIILAGISEMTENFEQQRFLVHAMVQKKFEGILEKGIDDEEILKRTKKFVKSELEKKVEDISGQRDKLESDFEAHSNQAAEQIGSLVATIGSQKKLVKAKEDENISLKKKLKEKHVQEQISKWQSLGYWLLPLGILIFLFFLLQLFFTENQYNLVQKLVTWIDNNPSETKRTWLGYLNCALLAGLGTIIYVVSTRLFSKSKREEKMKSIIETISKDLD